MKPPRRSVSLRPESYAHLAALAKRNACSCSAMLERLITLEAKRVGVIEVPARPPIADHPQHMEF